MTTNMPVGASPRLYNEDLAPAEERKWGFYSLFAMWMSDIHSVGGYTFAGSLFALGIGAWLVFGALSAGIIMVFFLMNLSGYMGQKTGVPYPVLSRISFGVFGANLPALTRGIVAIAWYGVQTWLASQAVVILAIKVWPSLAGLNENKNLLGESTLGWLAFLLMWALQLLLLRNGMDTIRKFQDWAGPAVWVVMFMLLFYMLNRAGWQVSLSLPGKEAPHGMTYAFFAATAMTVTYFATLMLNFCDFSRFAPDRKSVRKGNLWGLPVNFMAFSIVSTMVTACTIKVFGEMVEDPVQVVGRIDSVVVLLIGAITFAVATVGINVVANFVSPAYDIANIAPKHLDFKKGGFIAAIIALVITPWNLFNSPEVIGYFLGSIGAVLGPLFGVMMVDYFTLRKERVVVSDLFRESGFYYYSKGWNLKAIWAFLVAAVPAIAIQILSVATDVVFIEMIAPFAWFFTAAISMVVYYILMRGDTSIADSIRAADEELHARLRVTEDAEVVV